MSCETASRNATPPTPAIRPGAESLVAREIAARIGAGVWAWPGGGAGVAGAPGIDPRVASLVPGFDAPFFQAGLAGYSDGAMRIIARRHGCPFCVTEALLDRTLLAGGRGFDKADLGELHDNVPGGAEDHPLACQIMGSEPAEMAASAVKAIEQRTRSDKAYRMLAGAPPVGAPPLRGGSQTQVLRLPGGEQLGKYDPSEDLEDDCESWSCGVEEVGDADAELAHPNPSQGEGLQELAHPNPSHGEGPPNESTSCLRASVPSCLSFQAIDVNLACPVKKIEKKSRGGHWLTDPAGAIAILEAVREAVPSQIPCTVKLRRSFDDTPEMVDNFHAIFDACYRIGYAWTTVHARTVEQKYVGPSRWDFLRDLRARNPDKIILGSGDVWTVDDIFLMIAYSGMSGVSVARGCIGNPWIFRQAREMMAGKAPSQPTIAEQRAVLAEHFRLSLACTRRFRQPEQATAMMMRKFAIRFAAHHPEGDAVRRKFIGVSSTAGWRAVLDEHYALG
jgi:tRNA-dihydrouridine synthase